MVDKFNTSTQNPPMFKDTDDRFYFAEFLKIINRPSA